MEIAVGRIGLHFIRIAGQRLFAGISQSELGRPAPGPRPVLFRVQSGFFGYSHPAVIVWCIARSRVAAQTGGHQRCNHRFFDFNAGIRRGLHFNYLCPAGSYHDGGTAFCRFRYRHRRGNF